MGLAVCRSADQAVDRQGNIQALKGNGQPRSAASDCAHRRRRPARRALRIDGQTPRKKAHPTTDGCQWDNLATERTSITQRCRFAWKPNEKNFPFRSPSGHTPEFR